MNRIQTKLQSKVHEVYSIQPNDLGFERLNFLYHDLVSYLKIMPFIYIVPLSILVTFCLYLLVGPLIVKLASLLQYGF